MTWNATSRPPYALPLQACAVDLRGELLQSLTVAQTGTEAATCSGRESFVGGKPCADFSGPVGAPALVGMRNFITGMPEWASDRRPIRPSASFRSLIARSVSLQDYRRRMFARYENHLATLRAEETGVAPGSSEPFVAAVALIGMLRAAFEATDHSDQPEPESAEPCLRLLAAGLDNYAPALR